MTNDSGQRRTHRNISLAAAMGVQPDPTDQHGGDWALADLAAANRARDERAARAKSDTSPTAIPTTPHVQGWPQAGARPAPLLYGATATVLRRALDLVERDTPLREVADTLTAEFAGQYSHPFFAGVPGDPDDEATLAMYRGVYGDGIRMGAGNVKRAFEVWGGKLPPLSMVLLLYMANASLDRDGKRAQPDKIDTWPWFEGGYDRLAVEALRRKADINGRRAVSRAMEPLLKHKVIKTERKASNRGEDNSTARYRVNLRPDGTVMLTQTTETVVRTSSPNDEIRPVERRNVVNRATVSDPSNDGNRRGKEYEEELGGEEERATAPPTPSNISNNTHDGSCTRACRPCGDYRKAQQTTEDQRARRRAEADRNTPGALAAAHAEGRAGAPEAARRGRALINQAMSRAGTRGTA